MSSQGMPSSEVRAGDVLDGRYQIVEEIGRGGMGCVFAARDLKLDREVAVKVIAGRAPDQHTLTRFLQEWHAAGSISHPNVVGVLDVGTHGGGPYFVSELLRGESLRDLLSRRRPTLREAVDWGLQAAHGLEAAHDTGIVHRDFKPDNVFLTNSGFIKILDFGIVKLVSGIAGPLAGPLTETGHVVGTASYMAPEQVRGHAVDHRADLFAFGAVFYELLAGRRAFEAGSAAEIGYAILNAQPPPLGADVPAALAELAGACLVKDPAGRIPSAKALVARLEALRSATVSGASATGPRFRSALRKRAGIAAIALVGVIAAGLLAGIGLRRSRPGTETPLVTLAIGGVAPRGPLRSAGEVLEQALRDVPQVRTQRIAQGDRAAGAEWLLRLSYRPDGEQTAVAGRFETPGGEVLGERFEANEGAADPAQALGDLRQRALDELTLLVRDRERRVWADKGTSNATARARLLAYFDAMGLEPRPELLGRGRRLLQEALAADPAYLPAMVEFSALWRASAGSSAVDSTSALHAAKDAAEAALRISPNDGRALLMRCWAMKSLLLELPTDRDLSETIAACEAAVQADPGSVPALHALGALYDQSCQDDLAVLSWQRGMEIGRRLDRSWEGRLRQGLVALALQHHRLGDAESQLDALQALQAQEERFGPRALSRRLGPGPVRSHHVVRAAILLRRGATDAAEAELWRELRHAPEQPPPEPWAEAASLQGLTRLAHLKGKTLLPEYVRRLSDLKARFRAEESSSSSFSTLASAFSLVDVDAAIEWMRVVKPQNTCDVALQRAALLRDANRLDDARRALQECGSSERWVKHCAQVMLYDVPPAPELSSVR